MKYPNYETGFYPASGTPRHPNLWHGCVGAWFSGLGRAGDRVYDNSGRNYTASFNGSMSAVPRSLGRLAAYSMDFTGSGDFADASGPQNDIDSATKASLVFWCSRSSASNTVVVGFGKSSVGSRRFQTLWFSNSVLYFIAENDITAQAYGSVSLGGTGEHCLCLSYDGTQSVANDRLTAYVDGRKQSLSYTGTIVTALATAANLGDFFIGKDDSNSRITTGLIDDVRLYNRTIHADEAKLLASRRGVSYDIEDAAIRYKAAAAPAGNASSCLNLTGVGI